MPRILTALISFLLLVASGCSSVSMPGLYKIDIRQGNHIDQTMVDNLRPGMSKRQVQFLLGTPLIADPFHQDRWDYLYSFRPGGDPGERRHISLFFQNDVLTDISGDLSPDS